MKKIWNLWKHYAQKIGDFQFTLILSILYFILVLPIGVFISLSKDFLGSKGVHKWKKTEDYASNRKKVSEQ